MTRPPPKLEWRGVSKRFGAEPVLNRLNLTVPAGCSLVIIGGSGQGKSVMIKLALGLIRPDAGGSRRRSSSAALRTHPITATCDTRQPVSARKAAAVLR